MVRIIRMLVIVGIMVCMVGGCSSLPTKDQTAVTINPSRSHEECFELSPSEVLHYSFKASEPVNFNIHYHEEEKITFSVTQDNIAVTEGKFSPEKKQFYCLMWTNVHRASVSLSYTFSIGKE
ncbi:MAG: hypothetical protein ACLPX5_05815 [Dissulfurispiraceae bacterium]